LKDFFRPVLLTIRSCTGESEPSSDIDHILIQHRHGNATTVPSAHEYLELDHNFEGWIQSRWDVGLAVSGVLSDPVSCWRKNGNSLVCPGQCQHIEIFFNLPSVLIIETGNLKEEVEKLHNQTFRVDKDGWNFPLQLLPATKSAATPSGGSLVYDLTARVFYNGSHFICRIAVPCVGKGKNSVAVYEYDGMVDGGYSHWIEGDTAKQLGGSNPPIRRGYWTAAVIYRLRGGARAQEIFQKRQIREIKKHFFGFNFDSWPPKSGVFQEMKQSDRACWWDIKIPRFKHSPEYQRIKQAHGDNGDICTGSLYHTEMASGSVRTDEYHIYL
jgi:hypothetical protein